MYKYIFDLVNVFWIGVNEQESWRKGCSVFACLYVTLDV